MLQRISNLIDLKSIVTLTLISVFSYLALKGVINADKFAEVVMLVMVFYFAKTKKEGE